MSNGNSGGFYVFSPGLGQPRRAQDLHRNRKREKFRNERKAKGNVPAPKSPKTPADEEKELARKNETFSLEAETIVEETSSTTVDYIRVREVIDLHVIKPAGLAYYAKLALW